MERLLGNVYSDYPELEKLNIQVRAVDDIKGAVGLYQGGRRIDIKSGANDNQTQTTIFHEALHVSESVETTFQENKWLYGIKEAVVHISDGGHDPWIDSANLQYSQYLNYGDRSDEFTKPNLSDAPWRQ